MYSALHIMQWVSQILDVFTPKIRQKFCDFYILWIKTNVAYTRLEVIARIALQLQCQTDLLLCTINCFPQWARFQNMVVGDLTFYYTLYLWHLCHGGIINLEAYTPWCLIEGTFKIFKIWIFFAYFRSSPLRSTLPQGIRLNQYEMRAIFTESLVYETLFITAVYGSNETHIIMYNLKTLNWNQLKFWKWAFFCLYLLIHVIKWCC